MVEYVGRSSLCPNLVLYHSYGDQAHRHDDNAQNVNSLNWLVHNGEGRLVTDKTSQLRSRKP